MLTLIFIIAFGILYSEMGWSLIKNGQRSFEDMSRMLKIIIGINYIFAVWLSAWGCLIFAALCSLYQMVIYKERVKNLSGPVA